MSDTNETDAKGFNAGADRLVTAWQSDWQPFFADVCARTGLSLWEAMAFHVITSSHGTQGATNFIAQKLHELVVPPVPKEPWEE